MFIKNVEIIMKKRFIVLGFIFCLVVSMLLTGCIFNTSSTGKNQKPIIDNSKDLNAYIKTAGTYKLTIDLKNFILTIVQCPQ